MKNMFISFSLFLLILTPSFARNGSGGGDIVGNGGGLAEQNFIYALTHLPEFITETLNNDPIGSEDHEALQKIYTVALSQYQKNNKLKFLSGKKNPGFFESETDPEVRLAKTDFNPDSTIYINLDLLYKHNDIGEIEVLSLPVMVASLVHEFGHQVEFRDHHYLDFLGAKVRRFIDRNQHQAKIKIDDRFFKIFSYAMGPQAHTLLNIQYGGLFESLDLRPHLKCPNLADRPIGFSLSNQHFDSIFDNYENYVVPFSAWIKVACLNDAGQVFYYDGDFKTVYILDRNDQKPSLSLVSLDISFNNL